MTKHSLATIALGGFLLLFSSHSFAQSLSKNNIGSFKFSCYPTAPIPLGYKLYAVVDENNISYPAESPVAKNIFLKSMKKVQMAEGADILIKVSNLETVTHPPMVFENRNRRDDEAPKYKAKQKKDIMFDIVVSDSAFIILQDHVRKNETVESQWMSASSKAEKSATLKIQSFTIEKELSRYNTQIQYKLGDCKLTETKIIVYGAKPKKDSPFDYTEINNAVVEFKKAAEVIKNNDYDTLLFKEKAQYCVDVWEKELEECNHAESDKLTEEMVASLHYNLASYNILCKNYEEAMYHLSKSNKIKSNFGNTKDLLYLVHSWENLKKAYEKMIAEAK